ncbi:MAG: hypothetical protein ACRDI1_07525 [Actinomycetota bacterium]
MERLALEERLAGLPGVIDLNLDRDERGAVLRVRATVSDEHSALELRRNVASVVGERFAAERLDLKTPTPAGRVRLMQVSSSTRRDQAVVEVSVGTEDQSVSSSQEGMSYPGSALRLAANAALEAVVELMGRPAEARLLDVTITRIAGETVVVAGITVGGKGGVERLYGASGIGDGAPEAAAARAVLDAVNRIL